MGGLTDFLFEGKAPPSVNTSGTTTTDLPPWLSAYTQDLIGRANAVAAEPFQPYDGPRLAGLNADQQRAFDITRNSSGMYTPWVQNAQQNAQGALGRAMPFINQAGQKYPDAVDEYMNPYVENVINRGSQLATRTLNEQLLPSVERVFGASGGDPRSSAYRRTVDRGVRELTEGLNAQNQAALSDAYTTGAQIFGQDASRLGALGQTVGNLSLESAQLGGALAGLSQDMTLKDAAAQAAVGETIQDDTQRSLDLAFQDFTNQRDYPRQALEWLSQIIQGTPRGAVSTTQGTGPAEAYQPSGAAQLGSLITTGLGAWNAWKGKARGGRIHAPRGALAYA